MLLSNRAIIAVSGEERLGFLQGLVTNDLSKATHDRGVYSCLLTAQGRFLHDFFVVADGERLLLDCEADRREDLIRRLKQFRLRAKVDIADEGDLWDVHVFLPTTDGHPRRKPGISRSFAFDDPRSDKLGTRLIVERSSAFAEDDGKFEDYDRLRISLAVPDGSRDMMPEQALLLENNIDLLHGIDWNKGCYIGQEVTARMHYRGGVKRQLTTVTITGSAPAPGTPVTADDSEIGEMRSSCGNLGLALLKLDTAGEILSGEARLDVYRL